METVRILAGTSTAGEDAFEEVLVERLNDSRFRLVKSPGLVLGLAAGDEFTVSGTGRFEIVKRGGNIAVHWFLRSGIEEAETFFATRVGHLGGRIDGRARMELVLTIPASTGFPDIEKLLGEAKQRFPESEWNYGNVYDPADGLTPLGWWDGQGEPTN